MSIPASSPIRPRSLPALDAGTGVAVTADAGSSVTPLDFLLVTSRADFKRPLDQFEEACHAASMQAEVIYIEDLPGATAGEKLSSLHQLNAARQASGAVTPSTIKVVLLHGGPHAPPADASVDRFRRACLGPDASPPEGPRHYVSAANGTLGFPTELVDAALRRPVKTDGSPEASFADTIIYGACGSGLLREAASETGGSYVLASGRKSLLSEDFNAGLAAVVREQGERKRKALPPLSGRDCWNVMRQLSGEHVALVDKGTVEIHKILLADHGEPMLRARTTGAAKEATPDGGAQAIRTLFAKAHHGSAASLKRVIDRWGPSILSADHGAVIPGVSLWSIVSRSTRDAEQKALLLMQHAPDSFAQSPLLLDMLKRAVECQWTTLLAEAFRHMAAADPLPLKLEKLTIWLRRMPKETEQLTKLCRHSRDLNYALGAYLVRLKRETSPHMLAGPFALPPFFDELAQKSEERLRRTATQ